jgi:ABC-2 type transport system ATP-binding protein
MIEVKNLTKTYSTYNRREGVAGSVRDLFSRKYSSLTAVDSISFEVGAGELIGYIGPNGAGKSTSIKMLTGILKPTSGEMLVNGYHPFRQRKEYTKDIGVVFGQRTQLWWDIAVRESFSLLAKIYDVPPKEYKQRLDELIEILDLEEVLARPVRKLSLGQRMKSDLAASLLHKPSVLFLDEPTIGLDAVAKDSVRKFLRKINQAFKTTIILTTHDLKEIEELCKRIIVLDKGHVVYDGTLSKIKTLPGLSRSVAVDFAGAAPIEQLQTTFGERISLSLEGERRILAELNPQQLGAAEFIRTILGSYDIADLTISEPSIEHVIMKIYKEGVSDQQGG